MVEPEKTTLQTATSPTEQDHVKEEGTLAWLQVLGSFFLNFNTWGLLGSFGVFQAYYTQHILSSTSASSISWIGSTQGFFMFFLSFLIGPLFDARYLHSLLWTGSVLSVLGFLLTSFCARYWQFLLSQGIAMGIGFGCVYLPGPSLVAMHFEKRQGLAMGVSSAGSGLGAVIFPIAFTHLVDEIGFPWTVRVLSFILLATSIVPLAVMRFPNGNIEPSTADDHESGCPTCVRLSKSSPSRPLTFHRYFASLIDETVWCECSLLFLITGLVTTFMGLYTILYYVNLLSQARTSSSPSLTAQTLTIVNAASAVGRIAPSILADTIGAPLVLSLTAGLSCVLAFTFLAVHSAAGLIVWSIVFGSVAGAFMGLPASGIVRISLRKKRIGARIGMTLGVVGIGVLTAEPVAGAILKTKGSWLGVVAWAGSLMGVGATFLALALGEQCLKYLGDELFGEDVRNDNDREN